MIIKPYTCRNLHIFFFFNDTATTEIYTLSLHDALPIYASPNMGHESPAAKATRVPQTLAQFEMEPTPKLAPRSEEHTSELQSRLHLVCRLLLEKKKNNSRSYYAQRLFSVLPQYIYYFVN